MKNTLEIKFLTGLRGFACLLVLLSHAGLEGFFFNMHGAGQLGVMLFFTLSGFLMFYHYADSKTYSEYCIFLIRRIARIYPAYFCAITLAWLLTFNEHSFYYISLTTAEWIEHAFLVRGKSIFWTIAIEVKFYIYFCIFLILTKRINYLNKTILSASLYSLFCILNFQVNKDAALNYVEFFLSGMVVAGISGISNKKDNKKLKNIWCMMSFLSLIVIISIIPPIFLNLLGYEYRIWKNKFILSLIFGGVLFFFFKAECPIKKIFENRLLVFLGKISYSLYLFHWFAYKIINSLVVQSISIKLVYALFLALLLAYTSYILIEVPMQKKGKFISSKIRQKFTSPTTY